MGINSGFDNPQPAGDAPSLGGLSVPQGGSEASLGGARGAAHQKMAKRKLAAERMAMLAHLPEMQYLMRPGGEIASVQKNLKAFPAAGRESVPLKTIVNSPADYPYFSLGYHGDATAPFHPILDVSVRDDGLTISASHTPAGADFPSVDQQLMNAHFAKAVAAHMGVGLIIEVGDRPEGYQLLSALSVAEGDLTIPESSVVTYAPQQLVEYAQQRLSI